MSVPTTPGQRGAGLYLLSMLLRRLGLLAIAIGAVRYGLTAVQANLPHETVATIESARALGMNICVASDIKVFKLMHAQRLKGMTEEQIQAEHERQCEGATTGGANVTLMLAWNDHTMAEHKTLVLVSSGTADKLIQSGRLQRNAVRIRYASTTKETPVVLMEEIEASQRESGLFVAAGAIAGLLGLGGGLAYRARRR